VLLGLAVLDALEREPQSSVGKDYWNVLRQLERLSLSSRDAGDKVNPEQVVSVLKNDYDGYEMNQSGVQEQLKAHGMAAYALDWLVVASRWLSPLEISPGGSPRQPEVGGNKQ
jgi:hypothetical protein